MMRICHVVAAVILGGFLSACGGASAGDSCNTDGFLCQDGSSALECRLGTWRQLPCRGPTGCKVENSRVSCDMTGNIEGDPCAATTEGEGLCDASGTAALQCRQGVLVKTATCQSCSVVGEEIVCNP